MRKSNDTLDRFHNRLQTTVKHQHNESLGSFFISYMEVSIYQDSEKFIEVNRFRISKPRILATWFNEHSDIRDEIARSLSAPYI